jgi:hypothetical protein
VRLLYYAVAICIDNAWRVFNARRQDHVIAHEAKISALFLMFSVPTLVDHQRAEEDDNG